MSGSVRWTIEWGIVLVVWIVMVKIRHDAPPIKKAVCTGIALLCCAANAVIATATLFDVN